MRCPTGPPRAFPHSPIPSQVSPIPISARGSCLDTALTRCGPTRPPDFLFPPLSGFLFNFLLPTPVVSWISRLAATEPPLTVRLIYTQIPPPDLSFDCVLYVPSPSFPSRLHSPTPFPSPTIPFLPYSLFVTTAQPAFPHVRPARTAWHAAQPGDLLYASPGVCRPLPGAASGCRCAPCPAAAEGKAAPSRVGFQPRKILITVSRNGPLVACRFFTPFVLRHAPPALLSLSVRCPASTRTKNSFMTDRAVNVFRSNPKAHTSTPRAEVARVLQ
jgi:hypothetical protein